MSDECGDKPGCKDVLDEVYLLLDQECAQKHAAELRRHLDECPGCLEQYGVADQIKQLLARKCGGDHAPDQLKQRLLSTLREAVKHDATPANSAEVASEEA